MISKARQTASGARLLLHLGRRLLGQWTLPPKLFAECWLRATQLGSKGAGHGANFRKQLS